MDASGLICTGREVLRATMPDADNWRDPQQREFYLSGLRLAVRATDEAASPSERERRL